MLDFSRDTEAHEHLLPDHLPSMRWDSWCRCPALLEQYRRELDFYSCTVPALDQHVLARFLDQGHYEQTWPRMRKEYRTRHDAVLASFRSSPSGTGSRSRSRGGPLSPAAGHRRATGPCGTGLRPWASGWAFSEYAAIPPCLRPHAGGELCRPQPSGAARGHGPAGGDLRGLMPAVHSLAKSRPPPRAAGLCTGFQFTRRAFPPARSCSFEMDSEHGGCGTPPGNPPLAPPERLQKPYPQKVGQNINEGISRMIFRRNKEILALPRARKSADRRSGCRDPGGRHVDPQGPGGIAHQLAVRGEHQANSWGTALPAPTAEGGGAGSHQQHLEGTRTRPGSRAP